jgi:hypothetical protein
MWLFSLTQGLPKLHGDIGPSIAGQSEAQKKPARIFFLFRPFMRLRYLSTTAQLTHIYVFGG